MWLWPQVDLLRKKMGKGVADGLTPRFIIGMVLGN